MILQILQETRSRLCGKYDTSSDSDTSSSGVKISFRLPDGGKLVHSFPASSDVLVSIFNPHMHMSG